MDHFGSIFSLLLMTSVTTSTFGSTIKANNPNGEELGTLLKRSHNAEVKLQGPKDFEDQDSKKSKRIAVAAGTVIAGAELTKGLLQELLNALANVKRKCAVGIENESGHRWQEGSTYFYSGTADENLPYSVSNGKAVLYGPRKTNGPVATGVAGVLAYYIPNIDKTLAVMFSVPFDYNLYQNWWNAKLYPGNQDASNGQYRDLYYHANPIKANGWQERSLGFGLKFRGSMSDSGQATLEIKVLRK